MLQHWFSLNERSSQRHILLHTFPALKQITVSTQGTNKIPSRAFNFVFTPMPGRCWTNISRNSSKDTLKYMSKKKFKWIWHTAATTVRLTCALMIRSSYQLFIYALSQFVLHIPPAFSSCSCFLEWFISATCHSNNILKWKIPLMCLRKIQYKALISFPKCHRW